MKSPLTFYLMGRAYDAYGSHQTFSLIAPFLLLEATDFGPAIMELIVTLHFPTKGPPRQSLERLYEEFCAQRLSLPKIVYRRSRQKASIDIASELIDGDDWNPRNLRAGPSLALFRKGAHETVDALRLLKKRVTAKDAFQLDAFLEHCEKRLQALPSTEDEFLTLQEQIRAREAAGRAAMSPWERLGIDWRDYHSAARQILDDPFFWEGANDFSPHGNDTGADLLSEYRKWIRHHPDEDPALFLERLLRAWGTTSEEDPLVDEAAVALAFAEIKLRGACRPAAVALARRAIQRQRDAALAAENWPHRDDRLKSLDAIEAKLQGMT